MDSNRQLQEELRGQAASWFAELHEQQASESQRAAFAQWLLRSPEHVEAYLHVTNVAAQVSMMARHSVDDLIRSARAEADEPNVIELRRLPSHAQSGVRERGAALGARWKWLTASATIAAAMLAWLLIGLAPRSVHIHTQAGEQRTLTIADGSVLHVQEDSALTVLLRDDRRDIRLERGEARFDVAKDPRRPFIVATSHATVRAIGTVFNVLAAPARTAVTVLEGHVEVASIQESTPTATDAAGTPVDPTHPRAQLAAGEHVAVNSAGEIIRDDIVAGSASPAATRRGVVFREEALANVVARFNQKGARPIRVDDPQLAQLAISGAFAADDSESLLEYLRRYHDVEVIETKDGARMLVRAPARR